MNPQINKWLDRHGLASFGLDGGRSNKAVRRRLLIAWWSFKEELHQLDYIVGLLGRTIPFLLIAVILLFLTGEVWQLVDHLELWRFLLLLAVFVGIGFASFFGWSGKRAREICKGYDRLDWDGIIHDVHEDANRHCSIKELRNYVVGELQSDPSDPTIKLNKAQKKSVRSLIRWAGTLQMLIVSLLFFLFLLLLGWVAVSTVTANKYLQRDPSDVFWLPGKILGVSAFVAAFSYLSFVLHATTRPNYVQDFLSHVYRTIRAAVYANAALLQAQAVIHSRSAAKDTETPQPPDP